MDKCLVAPNSNIREVDIEAQRWDAHPEAIAALFLKAKKEGRIERLPRIRGATKSVTIRMPNADRLEHGEAVPAPMDVSFVAA